jgi:hypothetical protein
VNEAPTPRIGAPFENAPSMAWVPSPMPISTLLEITDCSVSALPWVYSQVERQAVLLEEALVLAELGDDCSQPPRWPMAIFRLSSGRVPPPKSIDNDAARSAVRIAVQAMVPS